MKLSELKDKHKRTILFARLSVITCAVMAVGKIVLGIISASMFLYINAAYSVGLGLAKLFAVKADREEQAGQYTDEMLRKRQNGAYTAIGAIVLATSVVYMIYCVRMFLGDSGMQYGEITAIAIATMTVTEIVLAVYGVITTKRDEKPIHEAVKLTNFASSLISVVLTQCAILSFAGEGDLSVYNGLSGVIFGLCAAAIGLYMVLHMPIAMNREKDRNKLIQQTNKKGENKDVCNRNK